MLIFSPDTDTYHIGLPLLGKNSPKNVVIQLSNVTDKEEYLHLNEMIDFMYRDVSMSHLLLSDFDIQKLFQQLCIMSGCDYTSFFAGYSKKKIMEVFLQYHDFITGKDKTSGTLDDINVNGEGFLYPSLDLLVAFILKSIWQAFLIHLHTISIENAVEPMKRKIT